MNAIDVVRRAINFEETTQIPAGEINIDGQLGLSIIGSQGPPSPKKIESLLELLELDLFCLNTPDLTEKDGRLVFDRKPVSQQLGAFVKSEKFFIFCVIPGPWNLLADKLGMAELLRRLYVDTDSVTAYFAAVTKELVKLIKYFEERGAHGIMLTDNVAFRGGLLAPEKVLRETLLPWYGEIRKQCAVPLFFHSVGKMAAIVPQIITTGFDGIHPVGKESGLPLPEAKKKYGDKICLMGGLDPSIFLTASEEELIHSVAEAMTVGGEGGGYIFGTSSGLLSGMDPQKITRAYRYAHWYRLDQMHFPRT